LAKALKGSQKDSVMIFDRAISQSHGALWHSS
jgi:hypothetical protein